MTAQYQLADIAALLGAAFVGDNTQINGLKSLHEGEQGFLSFSVSKKVSDSIDANFKGTLICRASEKPEWVTSALLVDDPYLAFAHITKLFDRHYLAVASKSAIHPTAVVAASAQIGADVSIGAFCFIGENVLIGEGCKIENHVSISDEVSIGQHCVIWPNATLYSGTVVGDRCIIQAGAVLGADGFGYAATKDREWVKIYQNGRLVIEDDVEIGANSCIDRGAIGDTIIKKGVKIDNLVQIGHNVVIDEHSAMAAMVGIAGSTKIGKRCTLGGQSGFAGHLTICDDVHFTGQAMVTKEISEAGVYSSGLPLQKSTEWRKTVARVKRLSVLENKLKQLTMDIESK